MLTIRQEVGWRVAELPACDEEKLIFKPQNQGILDM